jgi:hypothetical protein
MYLYSVLHTEYSVQSHIIGAALRGGLARSPIHPMVALQPSHEEIIQLTRREMAEKRERKKLAVPPVMD